jgi:tetratricopeptide (TPR) repeat protein
MTAKRYFASLVSMTILSMPLWAQTQYPANSEDVNRALRHATPEWANMAPHMPDPATATPEALASAADVLRARRMQDDALDYYRYALKRGGDETKLLNDIGVTLLELNRAVEARAAFKRTVQLKPKYAQGWNNLGAAEYILGNPRAALQDYLKAVKFEKKSAVFHANLGTAYFEVKDFESGRTQLEKALQLDHNVFQSGGWAGVEAHVLSTSDRGRYCFEMAKMSAKVHDDENVVRWIARASEVGFDVKTQMGEDRDLAPYLKDQRILMAMQNARAIRTGQVADSGLAAPVPDHP